MRFTDPYCHTASIDVDVPAGVAFDFMADGMKHSEWAFGSANRRRIDDNLFLGTSMYSGRDVYVRIVPDPDKFIIDFEVGYDSDNLLPRIMARIIPGTSVNRESEICLVTLISWRAEGMSDSLWHRLCVSHETQMYLIKHMMESGA
jgi:hypothetical protein